MSPTTKICFQCKREKPVGDFNKRAVAWGGLDPTCRVCRNERRVDYAKLYRLQNPDYDRQIKLRRKYGLTMQDYAELLTTQAGCCAICERPPKAGSKRPLSVDHDHVTGVVRGLLCDRCNMLLSGLERREWLAAAQAYLDASETT